MKARVFVVALAMFAVAALLGAGFALLGPVKLIRILGMIALVYLEETFKKDMNYIEDI